MNAQEEMLEIVKIISFSAMWGWPSIEYGHFLPEQRLRNL